ncbi:Der GTPase-activating protein YihI [Thalassotalea sp. PS06]|uniref:Der GTPase-activating protein YihI n=1 Tax=Thalassotalea sp. PS06 TaxID=2594005 RepID=UPI001163FCBF|nr:GTPase-activating protein [Thalassotalea sp. PS06]
MARSKKSRKEGALMKAILPKRTPKVEKEKRIRKKTGNKPGTRQALDANKSSKSQSSGGNRDPRLGSKKPIALGVEQVSHPKPEPKPSKQEPAIAAIRVVDNHQELEQELLALENNETLQMLAARDEAGEALTEAEQQELQRGMHRYQELVAELGLEEQDEDSDQDSSQVSEDVLWDKLDDYDFSDYQDEEK